MSAGSWQAFSESLAEENRFLGELGAAALAMTSVLVFGSAADIEASERTLDIARRTHAKAHLGRTTMMRGGFGDLTLRQVCGHAPPALRRTLFGTLREMTTRGIALQITVGNNKSLIIAGLGRISSTIAILQKSLIEQPGTYKRRGTVCAPHGSVIVSRRA